MRGEQQYNMAMPVRLENSQEACVCPADVGYNNFDVRRRRGKDSSEPIR